VLAYMLSTVGRDAFLSVGAISNNRFNSGSTAIASPAMLPIPMITHHKR